MIGVLIILLAMTDNQYAIVFNDVSVVREGKFLLQEINLNVRRGERLIILGLNGSGKTTLLRLIAGFGYPSTGNISVLGKTFGFTDIRKLRKHVGWVYSDLKYEIPGYMRVVEVVYSGLKGSLVVYDNLERSEFVRVLDLLKVVEAENLLDRRFDTLSTGERQRVIIARALFPNPEILLLDEPCMGLDPVNRELFLSSVSKMLEKNKELTVIYVTHHVEEIVSGFQTVVLLDRGKIVSIGKVEDMVKGNILSVIYGLNVRVIPLNGRFCMHFE